MGPVPGQYQEQARGARSRSRKPNSCPAHPIAGMRPRRDRTGAETFMLKTERGRITNFRRNNRKRVSDMVTNGTLEKRVEMEREPVLVGDDNVFPIESFPPVIRNLAESFAETWETSPETVAMSML